MVKQADRRTIYTTLDGTEIRFTPFSWDEHLLSEEGLKQEYRDQGEVIDCPQYTVHFASGTEQKFDHDAKSILQAPPDTAPEDIERVITEQKELYAKYLDASARYEVETKKEMANLVYTESLAHIQLPADGAWEERQRKKHIRVPSDPEEKRQHYINTVLMKFRADQIELMATVVAVSMGATREADVETVKRSFLDSIWSNGSKPVSGRDSAGKAENPEGGKLDGQPPADNGAHPERVAINEGAV